MIPPIHAKIDNKVKVKDSCNCCRPSSCMSCFGKKKKHKHKTQQEQKVQNTWTFVQKRENK